MNYTQITEIERYQIKAYLTAGYTQQAITNELNRVNRLANERKQRHSHLIISDMTWRQVVNLLKKAP